MLTSDATNPRSSKKNLLVAFMFTHIVGAYVGQLSHADTSYQLRVLRIIFHYAKWV